MAIKDQFKKVKNMNLGNLNLNNITSGVSLVKDNYSKALEVKMHERENIYNFIAIDVVELHKEGKLNIPELDIHFDKLSELEKEIEELETEKQKMELQTKGQTTCSCGTVITINDSFCPTCGKTVDSGYITCSYCGNKVKSEQKFCPVCGNSIHDMNLSMMPMGVPQPGMMQQPMPQPGMVQQPMPQPGMVQQPMLQPGMYQSGMMSQAMPQMMPIRASELRMKECICGAKVLEGQTMCMECGRKI